MALKKTSPMNKSNTYVNRTTRRQNPDWQLLIDRFVIVRRLLKPALIQALPMGEEFLLTCFSPKENDLIIPRRSN
jgi:hypothetical protein